MACDMLRTGLDTSIRPIYDFVAIAGPAMTAVKSVALRVAGFGLLALGIAMVILPGPAIVIIPAALGILATEYDWARKALDWLRDRVRHFKKQRSSE